MRNLHVIEGEQRTVKKVENPSLIALHSTSLRTMMVKIYKDMKLLGSKLLHAQNIFKIRESNDGKSVIYWAEALISEKRTPTRKSELLGISLIGCNAKNFK